MKGKYLFFLSVILIASGCNVIQNKNSLFYLKKQYIKNMQAKSDETLVLIETDSGNMVVKLYNDTPLHRDNFIKLVSDGTYEGLLFHRVIKDFMVQGGDPTSKDAPRDKMLGSGDLGYTLQPEFVYPKYYHKKGALAAARMGDNVNPEKRSSASQFYIVTGKVFTDAELDRMNKQRQEQLRVSVFDRIKSENNDLIKELYKSGDKEKLAELRSQIEAQANEEAKIRSNEVVFSEEQRDAYTTIGGAPHLDNNYTVFGELIDGFDTLEKIQTTSVNGQDRPVLDIRMKMKIMK